MSAGLILGLAASALLLGFAFKALMPSASVSREDNWIGDGSGADSPFGNASASDSCGSDGGGDCGGGGD